MSIASSGVENDTGSSTSTFYQRYHDVQKTDIAINQLNIKAFWDRMDKELALCPKGVRWRFPSAVALAKCICPPVTQTTRAPLSMSKNCSL
jgi:hypothetical protein